MFQKILIANRGEIALRIVRALRELGVPSLAVFAADDAQAPHVSAADAAVPLDASGPSAYLDGAHLLRIAREHGCDGIHPGYGFLSENAGFAQACADAGLRFIGPTPAHLALLGDKARARDLARRCGVPLMLGSSEAVTLEQAQAFFEAQQAGGASGIMVKAIGGGGGRGMRAVARAEDLPTSAAAARRAPPSAWTASMWNG